MDCVMSIQGSFRGARHGSQYPSGLHRLSVSKVRGRRASRLIENAQPTRSHGATQVRDGSRPESAQGVLRPRVWRLVGAMSELSKAGQCSIANDVEPLQTRDEGFPSGTASLAEAATDAVGELHENICFIAAAGYRRRRFGHQRRDAWVNRDSA